MADPRDLADALSELAHEINGYLAAPDNGGRLTVIQQRAAGLLIATDAQAAVDVSAQVRANPMRFIKHHPGRRGRSTRSSPTRATTTPTDEHRRAHACHCRVDARRNNFEKRT